jgi:hypothetical protein
MPVWARSVFVVWSAGAFAVDGCAVERQAEAGDQERDGEHDADVEQVDQAFERVSGGVFDTAVAAESRAAIH